MPDNKRQYWLDLFTYQTWQEFLAAGGNVSGFRENRWKSVQAMRPGDILLCYLTGVSRWIGLLEVTGPAFQDNKPIWKDNEFPARVPVKVLAQLEPLTAVPIVSMKNQLSCFQNLKNPHAWTAWFRGSPARWSDADGDVVYAAVMEAVQNPVPRPFDPAKLAKVPPILKTESGKSVVIPDRDEPETEGKTASQSPAPTANASADQEGESEHTEIQWLLLKLGNDMGLDVWVAKNDRHRSYKHRSYKGYAFTSLPRLRPSLPMQLNEATKRTIELIDVVWLKGNSILAAFEIESTTQIFSGLLRLSDLIATQTHLAIPLYIVAPSERRNKVKAEVNRPTFERLDPPMKEMCSFISFEELRAKVKSVAEFVQHLKPDFIDSFAESCIIEEV